MTASGTKSIDSSSANNYFQKATEFYDMMEMSFQQRKWNATGFNAIHAAISASDALLALYGSIRNVSKDHKEAAKLLNKTVAHRDTKAASEQLRKILGLKNMVEYEQR